MPKKMKIRLLLIALILLVFLQLLASALVFLIYRETMSSEIRMFLMISIAATLFVLVFLHIFYYMLKREKNGIIKRLDDALMTSLSENEKLEEKKSDLEIQLRHTQKLESIGTLARGMAHDFNNLLSPILGYSDLALSRLSSDDTLYLYINEIVRAAGKAKQEVEQVLNFSRKINSENNRIDLTSIIEETVTVIRPLIPATVEIKMDLADEPLYVKADSDAVNQIIVNLCNNGWQAMEERGGTLTITTSKADNGGPAGLISVKDTGTGMDEETKKHIFEPFFSTRSEKSSSGLGLSVVQGIVGSLGGKVEVESTPGLGSTFSVHLPLRSKNRRDEISDGECGNEGHILLIDDDENITALICNMLTDFGYSIELYNSSLDALKVFREDPWKFKLIITDLTMPSLTGSELKKKMLEIRDDIPILIMTGYGSNEEMKERQILKKPFVKNELLAAIESLIQK